MFDKIQYLTYIFVYLDIFLSNKLKYFIMFGNIIIRKVGVEQQIKFVRDKTLEKLWNLLKKGRLDKAAEAEMIEHPEGLEDFIKAYLQKYKAFVKDNNKLFVQKQIGHSGLFPVFCEVFDYSQSDEKSGYEIMISLVQQVRMYPNEEQKIWSVVKAYFRKYGYVQADFAQLDDYCRIWMACPQYRNRYHISQKVEADFLLPGNRGFLLPFLKQSGRFRYHENEFRFLMMNNLYPQEVSNYLENFGKDMNLTEEEQRQLFSQNPKAVRCVKVNISSPVLFREFVLPEIRRQKLPILKNDVSQLIQLSWNCPVLLREYLKEYGYLEAEQEAELFFCANKQIRLEYGQKFGFDVENLINRASRFGVESRIASALKKEMVFVRGYISRATVLRFNLHWIDFGEYSRRCDLCTMLRGSSYGDQFYADNERYFSRDMLQGPSSYNKSNPFCRFWACIYEKDIRLRKDDTIPYRVIESLRRVRVLLENAAERHYLTA